MRSRVAFPIVLALKWERERIAINQTRNSVKMRSCIVSGVVSAAAAAAAAAAASLGM
jgi:hypothetical protein